MTPLPPASAAPARGGVKWPILVVGAALVVGLLTLLASGFGHNPMAVPDERTGDPAPLFALQDLDGRTWDQMPGGIDGSKNAKHLPKLRRAGP